MLDRPDLPGQPCEDKGRQIPHKSLPPHVRRREDIVALLWCGATSSRQSYAESIGTLAAARAPSSATPQTRCARRSGTRRSSPPSSACGGRGAPRRVKRCEEARAGLNAQPDRLCARQPARQECRDVAEKPRNCTPHGALPGARESLHMLHIGLMGLPGVTCLPIATYFTASSSLTVSNTLWPAQPSQNRQVWLFQSRTVRNMSSTLGLSCATRAARGLPDRPARSSRCAVVISQASCMTPRSSSVYINCGRWFCST